MSAILCIETATGICSVAVVRDQQILALEENKEGHAHAAQITLLIDAAIQKAGIELKQLDAVAVSKGPGSYTGLRVGVSTAKGLCYALDTPLISVNTLESLVNVFLNSSIPPASCSLPALYVPMLDARRMEVYTAVFDAELSLISPTEAKIIDDQSFAPFLDKHCIYFFGEGAAKCKPMIQHPNALFIPGIECSASGMMVPAFTAFKQQQFENVGWFEPFYLKDFAGVKPTK